MMGDKGIKAISNSIFVNSPDWLDISENSKYIVLSKETMKSEIDLFVFSLFVYNDVPFNENPSDSLQNLINKLHENEIILGGGVMFYDSSKRILPGCCCGLEQWRDIINNILQKKEPWLGHNPYPIIEYKEDYMVVWSDDYLGLYGDAKTKSSLQHIEFTNSDMEHFISQMKIDIEEFITKPFYDRIREIDEYISDEFVSAIKQWLIS